MTLKARWGVWLSPPGCNPGPERVNSWVQILPGLFRSVGQWSPTCFGSRGTLVRVQPLRLGAVAKWHGARLQSGRVSVQARPRLCRGLAESG